MKKQVFCGVFALALAVTGCGVQKKEAASDIVPENRQELTILHVDAGTEALILYQPGGKRSWNKDPY